MPFLLNPRLFSLCLALPYLTEAALTFSCDDVQVNGRSYNFDKLKGPHTVHQILRIPPSISYTTFTLDICAPLKLDKGKSAEDQCPAGTRVCGITQVYRQDKEWDPDLEVERVIPISGDYTVGSSRPLNPTWSSLNSSDSNADSKVEGLRLELNGGMSPSREDGTSIAQKTLIEFICDEDKTGLEGQEDSNSAVLMSAERRSLLVNRNFERDDDAEDPKPLPEPDKGQSLTFYSYKTETASDGKKDQETGVLRLTWRTKYACAGEADKPDDTGSGTSASWGFFTWFIIILFMGTAAYLIFGSWLNYTRHGARGWDLVPHGDAMRDVPYILKEWTRKVISSFQGGRGGYSAV